MNEEQEINDEVDNKAEEYKKLCDDYLAGWQRAKADFINYKNEEGKRVGDLVDFLKVQWVLELLKIADNFDRAINHKPNEKDLADWVKGIEMIHNQLKDFLKSEGVVEVGAVGEKFNPEFHEAIEEVESQGKSGEINEVLEKGYTMNNKLIRASKVKINK